MSYKIKYYLFICMSFPLHAFAQNSVAQEAFNEEDSARIKITRLSISSGKSDFSPFLSDNTLIFASGRQHKVGIVYYSDNKEGVTDLYFSQKKDSVNFKTAKPFPSSINSKYSEGPASLNQDGTQMFFSGNAKRKPDGPGLKIYMSKKSGKNWKSPQVLPFCKDGITYCHPVLMKDQKTLIFASDMGGGFGGMDLYAVTYDEGYWTALRNLGPEINSSANETFPFVSQNDILYFSSDKKNGLGGLDIYVTDLKKQDAGIKALDPPLNSKWDDFGLWTDSTGEAGYFSSDRLQSGDDLYYFNTVIPEFENCITPKHRETFCYTFYEEASIENNDTIQMGYEWDFGDGHKARELRVKHCFPGPGNYLVQLNIIDESSGLIFENKISYDLEIETPAKLQIESIDTVFVGESFILSGERAGINGYTIENMYWIFGDGKYNTGKQVKHSYKKNGVYTVEMGVKARSEATNKIEKFRVQKKVYVRSRN